MRKLNLIKLHTTTLLLFLSLGSFCQYTGSSFKESLDSKNATFYYVYDNTSGFAMKSGDEVSGLMIDVMKEFESFLKNKYAIDVTRRSILKTDFKEFMGTVEASKGGTFGLSNISITEERKKSLSFSPPCMDNVLLLLSHNSIPTLANLSELPASFDGLVAYTLPESSYRIRLEELKTTHYPGLRIEEVTTEGEIIQKIIEEKAFGILDFNYYLHVLQQKYPIKRHAVADLKNDQFGIIMPKGSDWEPVFQEFFDSGFLDSGRYSEIISTNLGNSALRLLSSVKSN